MKQLFNEKTLDKYLPKWVFYIILTLAIFFANYFNNMSVVHSTLGRFSFKNAAWLVYVICVFLALFQVAVFELIARIFYNYVSNKTKFKAFLCDRAQFTDTLRVFYIFRSLVLGVLFSLVYVFPYLIYFAVNVFGLLVSSIFYYLFFLYIKDRFINKEMKANTLLHMAIPFFVYSVAVLFINLVF